MIIPIATDELISWFALLVQVGDVFNVLDKDQDGSLTATELRDAMVMTRSSLFTFDVV